MRYATTIAGLRQVADNVDKLADEARDRQHRREPSLRNNARFLRRAALTVHELEKTMGAFADKIHKTETERDAARAEAASLRTQLGQAGEAQKTLDALTAAGKVADDQDVAALSDDPEDQPTPPVTPPTDATPPADAGTPAVPTA
jgi:predicted  nucleic acid-binding Zn-ribbon protein